jgi:hypothetical protein
VGLCKLHVNACAYVGVCTRLQAELLVVRTDEWCISTETCTGLAVLLHLLAVRTLAHLRGCLHPSDAGAASLKAATETNHACLHMARCVCAAHCLSIHSLWMLDGCIERGFSVRTYTLMQVMAVCEGLLKLDEHDCSCNPCARILWHTRAQHSCCTLAVGPAVQFLRHSVWACSC